MTVKLLNEHSLEFLNLKEAAQARLESTLVKMPFVGNHIPRLNC